VQGYGGCSKEVLKAGVGIPGQLPGLFSEKITMSGRPTKYHITTVPKKIELSDNGTY